MQWQVVPNAAAVLRRDVAVFADHACHHRIWSTMSFVFLLFTFCVQLLFFVFKSWADRYALAFVHSKPVEETAGRLYASSIHFVFLILLCFQIAAGQFVGFLNHCHHCSVLICSVGLLPSPLRSFLQPEWYVFDRCVD